MSLATNAKQQFTVALPKTATRDLLLLVLLADTPVPAVVEEFGDYGNIFTALFDNAAKLATEEDAAGQTGEFKLTVESYDAVLERLPSAERVREADGVLITGSAASAYLDLPWIIALTSFVRSLPATKPSLRLIGICFGHQIISRAFGIQNQSNGVQKNPKGWEIGTRSFVLSEAGKALFPKGETLAIQHMHGDIITAVPSGFLNLGETPVCEFQGMVKLVDSAKPVEQSNIAIFTVQGHPEFHPAIVQKIINKREETGVFSKELAAQSRLDAEEAHDGIRIARVLLSIVGGV